jgi:hypothetical protein
MPAPSFYYGVLQSTECYDSGVLRPRGYGIVFLRILRIAAGLAIMLMAVPLLIQGGFSRYARYGIPAHPDWRYLGLAFVLLTVGSFLLRPYWWRYLGTHPRR